MAEKKLKGESRKALHRLNAINKDRNDIIGLLDKARKTLLMIVKKEKFEGFDVQSELSSEKKQQNTLLKIPKRIEFYFNYLKFYIDFSLVTSEGDGLIDIKGSIIYGTIRKESIYEKEDKNQGISRYYKVEDKPLIQFSVNQHGMIKSTDRLKGEWWIKEKGDLPELHYCALNLIWKEALNWFNENKLP